jgi:hypothetical protein
MQQFISVLMAGPVNRPAPNQQKFPFSQNGFDQNFNNMSFVVPHSFTIYYLITLICSICANPYPLSQSE